MRTIWIAAVLTLAPAAQAQERPPEAAVEADLYRDGALIYGPGYDEAYRSGLTDGYEAGFDDGRDAEAAVRTQDRPRDDGRVRTIVTTAGYGDGRTRFTEVPVDRGGRAAARKKVAKPRGR